MSVIPLALGRTLTTSEDEFERRGGRRGSTLLIRNFDDAQLLSGALNCSYDLRIGAEFKDHREGWKTEILDDDHLTLLPGHAVIIETRESLHVPVSMFDYIVPRVKWLQKGVSNTLSEIDPGYNGPLLITLFNLGKNTVAIPRKDGLCSLVIHDVGQGACLYTGGAKRIAGDPRAGMMFGEFLNRMEAAWQKITDKLEAKPSTLHAALYWRRPH